MLKDHNLQFTNATKFNDPFDCHPALFDYSYTPEDKNDWAIAKFLSFKGEIDMENLRNDTWLLAKDPVWVHAGRDIPKHLYGEELIDGKEIRYYPPLTADCFESIYLGVNILPKNMEEIIKVAKKLNPDIKIYQMTTDPEAFRLKAEQI